MSDNLVKRLREDQPVTQDMASTMQCALQDAAADRIKELEAKLAKAVEALGKLCFEVAGLQAFEQGVRHEIGNANYAAIMTRLNDGGVAIAAAKETT